MNKSNTFDDYDNFYTLLHKQKLTENYTVKHLYKIIYGHFIKDDFENIFEYKTILNGKVREDGLTHKCTLDELQKPNSKEEYFQFLTYEEIYKIKEYYDRNAVETEYVPPTT